jgi:hypothetical protein
VVAQQAAQGTRAEAQQLHTQGTRAEERTGLLRQAVAARLAPATQPARAALAVRLPLGQWLPQGVAARLAPASQPAMAWLAARLPGVARSTGRWPAATVAGAKRQRC